MTKPTTHFYPIQMPDGTTSSLSLEQVVDLCPGVSWHTVRSRLDILDKRRLIDLQSSRLPRGNRGMLATRGGMEKHPLPVTAAEWDRFARTVTAEDDS